jgi:hypothetical protein
MYVSNISIPIKDGFKTHLRNFIFNFIKGSVFLRIASASFIINKMQDGHVYVIW